MQRIKFFGIDRFYKNNKTIIHERIEEVFSSGRVMMCPKVESFENKMAKYCQRKFAVTVASCTDALYFALLSTGIQPGDEVLVTSYSFIASVSQIIRIGAVPVFVDIDPSNFMMNLNDLENKITTRTKAILAVHLFGQSLPIQQLEKIANKHHLRLIEDAAQSLGSSYNQRQVGSMGDVSCISFDPTKIVNAFGNGGILLTDDSHIYEKVQKLRYHGKNFQTNDFELIGMNSRISSLQATLLDLQLDQIDELAEKRLKVATAYSESLKDIDVIQLPRTDPQSKHIFHKYVLKTENRNGLHEHLKQNGIQTMIHYPKALFEYSVFHEYECKTDKLHKVNQVKEQVLSLPIYPELEKSEIQYIIESIYRFFKKERSLL